MTTLECGHFSSAHHRSLHKPNLVQIVPNQMQSMSGTPNPASELRLDVGDVGAVVRDKVVDLV